MSGFAGSTAAQRYYPHVDGLRAIAVLAVIAYHLDPRWLPGGFTGVDVFFVISGYVVSAALHGAGGGGWGAALGAFYVRRVRRIAPALVACLLVTGLAAALVIPPAWLSDASERTGLYAFVGLGNLVLAGSEGDYFSPRTEYNPYAHTWSLGVEEQFYLLFPVLFLAWMRGGTWRRVALALTVAAALASLAYAAHRATHGAGSAAFYLLPGRFWQLAAGVLLYQWLARGNVSREAPRWRGAGAAGALVLLLAAIALARPGHTPWPDGVWPVLGTVAVLGLLHHEHAPGRVARLLASPPLAAIGRLSYSLYLWHWPVFVLFRWTVGLQDGGLRALALLLTFGLAAASYALVERPLRRSRRGERWPRPVWLGLALSLLVLLGYGFRELHRARPFLSWSVVVQQAQDWSPSAVPPLAPPCRVERVTADRDGERDWTWRRSGCPGAAAPRRVFVLGDSHALGYEPLLQQYAHASGDEVRLWHRTGCAVLGLDRAPADVAPHCAGSGARFLRRVEAEARPGDVLFLPSLRLPRRSEQWLESDAFPPPPPLPPEARQAAEEAAREALAPLAARGVHIVFEAPKPLLPAPAYRCSDWFNAANPVCRGGLTVARDEIEAARAPLLASYARLSAELPAIGVWDPLPTLCEARRCAALRDGRPLFFDGDHLSGYGNALLAPSFHAHLRRLPPGPR